MNRAARAAIAYDAPGGASCRTRRVAIAPDGARFAPQAWITVPF